MLSDCSHHVRIDVHFKRIEKVVRLSWELAERICGGR